MLLFAVLLAAAAAGASAGGTSSGSSAVAASAGSTGSAVAASAGSTGSAVAPAAPRPAAADPVAAVSGLVTRILGAPALARFRFETLPADPASGRDVYELDASGSTVVVRGNTGVALATGLNNFLKYSVNVSISWGRNMSGVLAVLPASLPLPAPSRTVFPMKWRYAWNVCTAGYSFVWYTAEDWQFMIDWMALQGVNLPLAFNGQEKVFSDVFKQLGLTQQEIWAYFSGPAFLPWNRMGNMQAFGALNTQVAGLDEQWMQGQYDLQLTILAAMRAYGMTPVLPGFAGHVPAGLQRLFPNAQFTHTADWCGFNATYGSVALLQPSDPAFVTVGSAINKAVLAAFGDPSGAEVPHFNADTFNEMEPANSSLAYLAAANANVYKAMTAADPRAVYVMQGWLFLEGFWTYERAQAYLTSVPLGGMLVLDLYSDGAPQWNKYDSYFGHDWIWNSLIVFGGRRGIYGSLPSYTSSPYIDRNASASLVGVGVTPEAIDMSQPMFDVTLESGWRDAPPDPRAWLQAYAVRRYGGASPAMAAATDALYDAAYSNRDIDESIIEDVPGSQSGSRNTNATGILVTLSLYTQAFASEGLAAGTGPASYDLTDLTRQVLCNVFQDAHDVFVARLGDHSAASGATLPELTALATALLALISDIDATNSGDVNFLLGTWLSDAAAWGAGNASTTLNRLYNARNQITLWGPRGEINDYAGKIGWSGLVSSYYLPRWQNYTAFQLACFANASNCDEGAYSAALLAWEQAWSLDTTTFPTAPTGAPPLANAQAMLAKYAATPPPAAFTAHVGYDTLEAPPVPPVWAPVPGSAGLAAVGADCPWLARGDGGSVGACEASCDAAAGAGCNAVNFNAGISDCELRACADPAHIDLVPGFPGWVVFANTAPGGGRQVLTRAWHAGQAGAGVLAYLCGLTPACQGFTSAGKLTANATVLVPAAGSTAWVRAGASVRVVEGAAAAAAAAEEEGAGQAQAAQEAQEAQWGRPLRKVPLSPAKRARARQEQRRHL